MDPMTMFDMERRTGISNEEVDDFVNRMELISKAMEDIQNGTFDPLKCNLQIPGYKTPEQEEIERKERQRKEEERKRKEEERLRKIKEEEREMWWRKARLRFEIDTSEDDCGSHDDPKKANATQWANRVLAAYKSRDANDYSIWDQWVPEDPATLEEKAEREHPATLEEKAERERALDRIRNEEFEKNNPEFCQQFREDLEKRQKSQRDRERAAEKLKECGNRCYKKRDYEAAIKAYMNALEKAPFNVAVLTNIAQCYLRLDALDDSAEFSTP
ncbi:hypothetical protein P43SY_001490 [Pythium insidiosum]|uniref:Uncharacterized protein n=1 Tax=Pythium insidiosum TaxID=114742 RepID=A0AAD5M4P9_PYTIN|nr:hypothetical protein P43SY_001490 [Pythium insidiosum]